MRKGISKFYIAATIVMTTVAVIDWTVGKVLDWILPQISNQGDTGKTYYSLYDVQTPIVIVGSSRASHHYVTEMIEDYFHMSAYNVGRDGCFFSYNCCIVNSILDRYTPELIIWENGMDSLYDVTLDPLESLYPYYKKNTWVTNAIKEEQIWSEYSKLNSRLYQYNSILHRILMRYSGRRTYEDQTIKGYYPLKPKSLVSSLELKTDEFSTTELSKTKTERLRSLLERAQNLGVQIVIVDSPKYQELSSENLSALEIEKLCKQYNAHFLNNTQLPYFLQHPELFNDALHLNENGAKIYNEIFINQLMQHNSSSVF